jgi:hypothetical protein
MRHFSDKSCRETVTTCLMLCNFYFFENRSVREIMWVNMVGTDMTRESIYYGASALYAGKIRLQTHTHNM